MLERLFLDNTPSFLERNKQLLILSIFVKFMTEGYRLLSFHFTKIELNFYKKKSTNIGMTEVEKGILRSLKQY